MRVSEPSHIPAACAALATASRKPPDGAKRPESFRCESMRFGAIRNFFCVKSNVFQHAGGGMYIFTVPCHCPRSPQRPAVRRICPWRDEWKVSAGKNPEAPFSLNKTNAKGRIRPAKFTDASGQPMSYSMSYFDPFQRPCFHKIIDFFGLKREWWLGAELNRRHKDFQSSALPTELPSQNY